VLGLTPFQSLISKKYLSGNRLNKINFVVIDYLNDYLLETHAQAQGLSIYRSFIKYKEMALRDHPNWPAVCRKTFTQKLRQIPESAIARVRQGKRGANAAADPTDPQQRALKAQLPWQIAAIDHYK